MKALYLILTICTFSCLNGCATYLVNDLAGSAVNFDDSASFTLSESDDALNICISDSRDFNYVIEKPLPQWYKREKREEYCKLSANSSSTSCQAYYKKTAYIYLEKKNKSFFCNTSINDIQIVACSSVTTSNCYVTTYDDSGNITNLNLNVDSSESIYNIGARISHGNSIYSLLYILSVPWDIVTLPVQAVGLGVVFICVIIADDGWS